MGNGQTKEIESPLKEFIENRGKNEGILNLSFIQSHVAQNSKIKSTEQFDSNIASIDLRGNIIHSIPWILLSNFSSTLHSIKLSQNRISLPKTAEKEIPLFPLLESLELSENPLGSFPSFLLQFPALKELRLVNSQISKLLPEISSLKNLEILDLFNCGLIEYPPEACNLLKLHRLDIGSNNLTSLPSSFSKLTNLQYLNIGENKLKELPSFISSLIELKEFFIRNILTSDISSVIFLTNLKKLDASKNHLVNLPEQFEKLICLRKLNVGNNKMESIPEILKKMNLEALVLLGNPCSVVSIPKTLPEFKTNEITSEEKSATGFGKISLKIPEGSTKLSNDVLYDKIRGLIFGAAIGDAIGLSTEFLMKEEAKFYYDENSLNFQDFIRDRHRRGFTAGDWTDDTDQLILILETLLETDGNIEESIFAKKLYQWAKNGFPELNDLVGQGIGTSTLSIISHELFLKDPVQVAKTFWENNGRSNAPNGALMRTAILGIPFFYDMRLLLKNTKKICHTTHADTRCLASCSMIVSCVALILRGGFSDQTDDIEKIIAKALEISKNLTNHQEELEFYVNIEKWENLSLDDEKTRGYTLKTLAAALIGWKSRRSFKETILKLIMEAGDADTNACVCGALIGCYVGYNNLPKDWIDGLLHKEWLENKINTLIQRMNVNANNK